ncbi:MAG: DNA gyrase subunit A, partial [Bacteroidales bacterium]|nr:DNA gyrase subunit A [Bacteroidales bacterium]
GKRSKVEDYRVTNRGGKGVKTINITERTGKLVALVGVNDEDHLMIINRSGITLRLAVNTLRQMARATQGVRLINLRDDDAIAAIAKIEDGEEQERAANELLNATEEDIKAENQILESDENAQEEDNTNESIEENNSENPENDNEE